MCGTLADVLAKLLLAFAIFVALSHSLEADDQDGNRTLLPDVALLFHGPYGERSYELTSRSDGALTLQEVDNGPIRLDIRRISKMPCTFVSIHKIASGLIIEQLDLTQFDGTYQLWNACNPSGSLSEHNCTNSLHFNSQSNGYCQAFFKDPPPDIDRVLFPSGACRPYGIGSREKRFYAKYIDALQRTHKKCGEEK
jgi:hypothetical protein